MTFLIRKMTFLISKKTFKSRETFYAKAMPIDAKEVKKVLPKKYFFIRNYLPI